MSQLKLERLENEKDLTGGKKTFRCPACAAKGADTKGEHLVVYADGRFGCVIHPNDKEHRGEILRLAGETGSKSSRHIVLDVKPLKIDPIRVLQTLDFGLPPE